MYGLVGKHLKHSFSAKIHNLFGNDKYDIYETNSIEDFIRTNDLKGFNVTIPYKTEIIEYLDGLDEIAKATNSVNTVIKIEGRLIGYNTDYYGLKETFSYYGIDVNNKSVLILGNGSVSNTVEKLLYDSSVKEVIKLCRTIKDDNEDLFANYSKYTSFDMIINTTPVGMYPNNNDDLLIDLKSFKKIDYLVDLIYNPIRTKLYLEAEKLGIKAINGLYMLVMQAKKANELFFNKEIPLNIANKVYRKIFHQQLNYVFIGLPLSGKTKYAKMFGDISIKTTKDTDNLIEEKYQMTIPEIFQNYGEKTFREYETSVVEDIYKMNALVISTGGGLIETPINMELLKQNGIIIFLNKEPNIISKKKIYGRPLLKEANDILILAKRRNPIYMSYADIIVNLTKDTATHINEIKEKVDEYINS